MKFQALLTTFYYLLFSSNAKVINETLKGVRETRAPKSTTIYHNGHPIQVHEIPQQTPVFQEIQSLASNVAPNKVESGPPKVALQRDKVVIKNENTYLQDSYGNRYYSPPQQLAYKAIFPQQFVALQDLPTHFSQPLLGPTTQGKQAYTLPHFSFSEPVVRPVQLHGDRGFFNFPKTAQSFPFALPPQQLNIPIQSHYKFGDAVQFISGNQQAPITFSYHKSPAQRFINFAPDQHIHHKSAPILHTSTQSTNNVVSQKIQSEHQQQQPREPSESRTSPATQQHPKQYEQKPVKILKEIKTIDSQYFEPQVFANPIVPQVQHYLPKIQSVLRYNILPRPQVPVAEIKIEQTDKEQERTPQLQQHKRRPHHNQEKPQPHQDRPQYHQERPQHHQEKQQNRQEKPKHHQERPHHQERQPQDHQERRPQHSERRPQLDSPFDNQIKEIVYRPENNNIVINEYTSPEKHEHKEEVKAEIIDEEENEEKNFNDGYHEAAKGFPAYSYNDDYEKKIFDEASYGEPHYHDSIPFDPSDESFLSDPDEKRSKYIITGSHHHNAYGEDQPKEFKPILYDDDKKYFSTHEKKPNGKWSKQQTERYKHPKTSSKHEYHDYEVPFNFGSPKHAGDNKRKSPSKSARYEIDYSKGYSLPHADRHSQEYHGGPKKHTEGPSARFVEPQYHYGFEPILESRQDSEEQASSASNVAPESEVRPSTMRKVYKENWFISKTSSAEADS